MSKIKTSLIRCFVETLERDSNRVILGQKVDGKWSDTTREQLHSMIQLYPHYKILHLLYFEQDYL